MEIYHHGPVSQDSPSTVCRRESMLTNSKNVYNGELVYDLSSTAFQVSADPIDDRIKKNMMIIDWIKRLDTSMITKYSYEIYKEEDQFEFYHYLSSKVLAREAINFLTVLKWAKKAVYFEFYNPIRDIYTFLRDAGSERYPLIIQIAAILSTLHSNNMIPVNPSWGYIRTSSITVNYGFSSQLFKITTSHIIVLQPSTTIIRQQTPISDSTTYNIFAAAVGLTPNRFTSITEWVILNCASFSPTIAKKFVKPPFTYPLTNQKAGSVVYVDGLANTMMGILLSNTQSNYCSILFTDGNTSYVEPNVLKALVTVSSQPIVTGLNTFSVL